MDRFLMLQIIEYVIRILVIVIGSYGIAFMRKYNLEEWVRIAVSSAEQMTDAGLLFMPKKEYVVDFINKKFKFGINEEDLDTLIEAMVKELNMLQGRETINNITVNK